VTLSITEKDKNAASKRNFYELKLERNKIMYVPTVWTLVHIFCEKSPLFTYSKQQIKMPVAQLYILINYYEESLVKKVYQLYSYDFEESISHAKYKSASSCNEEGTLFQIMRS
jgi:inward rectifier potassium channel